MDNLNLPNFYSHTVSINQNEALSLVQLGRDISSPGFSYPQYHNRYVINFVRSGNGTLESRGKKYNLTANDAFLTYPNELSIQTSDANNPWELYFFAFSGSLTASILENTVFRNGATTISLKDDHLAKDILEAVETLNSTPHGELKNLEYLFKFFSHFDVYNSIPVIKNEEGQHKYVSEIKKYIQANYLEPIKISAIANKLNINRSHLYRIFKEEMGIGVEDYIINIRMNHAKVLLKNAELSVAAVASAVGYKNYTTFFKMFKQMTGLTPLEYRNTIKNDA